MYIILDSLARIMAPILAFTAEEIWNFMPDRKENSESVHMTSLPVVNEAWKDEQLAENWKQIIEVRGEVTKALEEARVKKIVDILWMPSLRSMQMMTYMMTLKV